MKSPRLITRSILFFFLSSVTCLFFSVFFHTYAQTSENGADFTPASARVLRTQWNLVRWHSPDVLSHDLADAKFTPEGIRWCEDVERLVAELSACYPSPEPEDEAILRKRSSLLELPDDEKESKNNLPEADSEEIAEEAEAEIPTLALKTVLNWDFDDQAVNRRREAILQSLSRKTEEVPTILSRTQNLPFVTRLGRANYTLQRRLTVWKYCDALLTQPTAPAVTNISQVLNHEHWNATLGSVRAVIQENPYAETWANYIRYEHLLRLTAHGDLRKQRELAQSVLMRMDSDRLNESQKSFLSHPVFRNLGRELLKVATVRCPEDYLMYSLEEYESASQISEGNHLAAECLRGWFLRDVSSHELLRYLEYSYRNANIRMEVSSRFLNRLIPQREPEVVAVNEIIVGRPVVGRGIQTTDVWIKMMPDPQRFRLGFVVDGRMVSSTVSEANMVRVVNDSEAAFSGMKEVELTERGIHTAGAVAEVDNRIQLRQLETTFGVIPLVGAVANEVAKAQAKATLEQARLEMQARIHRQVIDSLDGEVDRCIDNVNIMWDERVLGLLGRLGIDFIQVGAETSEDSATVRWRLAGPDQLGGHTPRPMPTQHNLMNFQVHESAINNLLQQLKLDGRTFTFEQLNEHIALRFPKWREREQEMDADIPEDLVIAFPPTDSISVKMAEGQIMLQLSIARLKLGGYEWENFKIHVPYRVETEGFQALVRRDGVIRLIGKMKLGQQIAIRGVFSKAFPKDMVTPVIPEQMQADPRFSVFVISQCVMQDGWLAISVGEHPAALRTVVQGEPGGVVR